MDTVTLVWAGLALGFAHAFEGDHLAAATTMAADRLRGDDRRTDHMAPILWAVGHAVGLFSLGMLAIGVSSALPVDIADWAERLVGPVLVLLGVRTMVRSGVFHRHVHKHDGHKHEHFHVHLGQGHHHGHAKHATPEAGGRHTPLLVGALHGVAGTGGALILAAGAGFASPLSAAAFLACFGVGTITAMALYGGAFHLAASRMGRTESVLQGAMVCCGLVSAAVGVLWISRLFAQA